MHSPSLWNYVKLTRGFYDINDLKNMEAEILKVLNWNVGMPSPLVFLTDLNERQLAYATYLCTLVQLSSESFRYLPSTIAECASWMAIGDDVLPEMEMCQDMILDCLNNDSAEYQKIRDYFNSEKYHYVSV